MSDALQIGEAARWLNVTPEQLRALARDERIPRASRDPNVRIYSEINLAFPRALGVGRRPRQLRSVEEPSGAAL